MLLLRVALLGSDTGSSDILVGDGNIPGSGIDMCIPDQNLHGLRPVCDLFLRISLPHYGRMNVRNQIDIEGTVLVIQADGAAAADPGRNMDAALFHDTASIGYTLGRVMVSADDKDLKLSSDKLDQEIIHQIHRFHGRDRFVIDIPGDHDRVGMLCIRKFQDLIQDDFLILDHGKTVDAFSEMEIRKMEKFHRCSFITPVICRLSTPSRMCGISDRAFYRYSDTRSRPLLQKPVPGCCSFFISNNFISNTQRNVMSASLQIMMRSSSRKSSSWRK